MKKKEIKDPRVRKHCPVCGKTVPEVAIKNNDPFCSSPCCRKWWGTELGLMKLEVRGGAAELCEAA